MGTLHRNKTDVFAVGDKVTPRYIYSYFLTMGEVYTVLAYNPPEPEPGRVTFPAYVSVKDDRGRVIWAHACRFKGA